LLQGQRIEYAPSRAVDATFKKALREKKERAESGRLGWEPPMHADKRRYGFAGL